MADSPGPRRTSRCKRFELPQTQTDAVSHKARKVLDWPKRCKLAHAFLWEYSYKRLKLAQLLGQLGGFLTVGLGLRREAHRLGCGGAEGGACGAPRRHLPERDGGLRAQSHCRFVLSLIHSIPDSLSYIFGASVSETTMRPNHRRAGRRTSSATS